MSVTAALLMSGVVWLAASVSAVSHIALMRTLTICAITLVLAYIGSHWQRVKLAYAALVFVASKLVFEYLRQGHLAFVATSETAYWRK